MRARRRAVLLLAAGPFALTGCGVADGRAGGGAGARSEVHPPVVLLSLDEISTTSLLDGSGRIDGARYPNFAELAREGNWFPYATASSDETGRATEALLTGSLPARGRPPTYGANPRNLFTLLGGRYRIRASEEATSLCPRRLCPGVRLPTRRSVLHRLATGRPERFARWLHSVRPSRRPTLYFKHLLLPHGPWRYLPDGQLYVRREPIPGWGHAFSVPWVATQKYQRHLLQLEFTDRLLGSLLARLKRQGLYERALIVVTADNGEAFGQTGNGHEVSAKNVGYIALTPLIIKAPFRHDGSAPRRHVRTIDVLPTVARLARLGVPWRVEGHSVYGSATRKIPSSASVFQRSGRRFRLSLASLRRWSRSGRERKLELFGEGRSAAGLYRIGPYRTLVGTAPSSWPEAAGGSERATLNGARAFGSVRLASGFVPAYVSGRLSGPRPSKAVAVALNGRIVATSPAYRIRRRGSLYFSALVPDRGLGQGPNEVQLYAISGPRTAPRLQPLGP